MNDLPTISRHAVASSRIAIDAAILLLSALLTLGSSATADVGAGDPHFGTYEVVVVGGPWVELRGLADAYWARRGLRAACAATVWVYDDADPQTAAIGQQPGCDIGFNRPWLQWVRSAQRTADRYGRRAYLARLAGTPPIVGRVAIQRHLLAQVCLYVVHERGHNVGLAHSSNPREVMYRRANRPPAECRRWAAGNWRRFARLKW